MGLDEEVDDIDEAIEAERPVTAVDEVNEFELDVPEMIEDEELDSIEVDDDALAANTEAQYAAVAAEEAAAPASGGATSGEVVFQLPRGDTQ